eukprot:TRINITY_DN10768_c0_g1_i1.p1 TRINITY_DN10768_c0_g1~~TRINITY_DN10768_c0_g1_i1.p1  ORF type:complete len:243 (-),score=42.34 TRINITY_DN10768_c0_g1_i1:39-710(-)
MSVPAVASFSEELWSSIGPIWQAILDHPFIRQLTDGTLPMDVFHYYLAQDYFYLLEYSRGIALMGQKADPKHAPTFMKHAESFQFDETLLHFRLGLTHEDVSRSSPAPSCLLYTSHLIQVALERPFHEVLGAYLPCYWIYWEVGKHLLKLQQPGIPVPFEQWIGNYGGGGFGQSVMEALAVVDEIAPRLTGAEKNAMKDQFILTSRMEWMFWDMALKLQQWPV